MLATHSNPNHVATLIRENVPLKDKNWFQTGGPARYFCEPADKTSLQNILLWREQNNLRLFVLGQGANILIADQGFDGLVVRPALKKIERVDEYSTSVLVKADAGVTMADLIAWCLDHTITGLEEFSGIPGTVGGSVYINLHYFEFLLSQFLVSATVLEHASGKLMTVDTDWLAFGYNQSRLHTQEHTLVDATFALKKSTSEQTAFARGRAQEIIRHRTMRYPSTHTCGSFFRNFHDDEVSLIVNGKKAVWIAYYLDKIGIKGSLAVGGAAVSYQHANMLINTGTATTQDIIDLARSMQELVHQQFGVIPQPECQLIGFDTYPLKENHE